MFRKCIPFRVKPMFVGPIWEVGRFRIIFGAITPGKFWGLVNMVRF